MTVFDYVVCVALLCYIVVLVIVGVAHEVELDAF